MSSIEALKELVAVPSLTADESAIATYVADHCDRHGHSVTMVGDSVAVGIKGAQSGSAFILSGHLDTVPDVDGWKTDPFELVESGDDILIGLGVGDMKAGLTIMLDVAEKSKREKPPCDTWFFFSSREEDDNEGAKQLAAWFAAEHQPQYHTIGGLILEPTVDHGSIPFVGIGHRNGLVLEVTAEGEGGHGSQSIPDGATAIEKLSRFIAFGLPAIRAEWDNRYAHNMLGVPSINATDYHAGIGKHNIIPAMARLVLDLRTSPALDDALPDEIVRLQQEYGVSIVSPREPSVTVCPSDSRIYHTMQRVAPEADFRAYPCATDLFAYLREGIPMLMYGPGQLKAMHKPNEWIKRPAIDACARTIEQSMLAFAA